MSVVSRLSAQMPRQIRRQTLWDSDRPVREDLFGIDRLEDHARHLAAAQTVLPRRVRGQTLNRRLDSNAAALLAAYGVLAAAIDAGRPITPAAEWLVDNYHVIERQVRDINTDLPHGYYRQLPKLAAGPFAGYPRVFGLAWAFVAHTDSHFDPELLHRFLRAYQEVQPLTIGELWAVSMTLRIVLVENLRRLAQRIISSRAARQQADVVADRMLGTGGLPPEPLPVLLAELATTRLSNAFAVQLIHRLRDQDPRTTPVLDWLHQRLSAGGVNADTAVQDVHRDQGASNVTVRNIITSLRMIADVDWTDLVERSSLADAVLSAGTQFAMMDFATRTLYRSAIEDLARGSRLAELDIARAAAKAALSSAPDSLAADPGYHLLAGGLRAFERALGYRPKLRQWPARVSHTLGIGSYALAIAIATAILLALPLLAIGAAGLGTPWLAVLAVLGAIPAIDAAFALTNRLLTASYSATLLPGLELRDGVPAHLRTMVAVPVMLTSAEAIATQIERLEVHHLASPEGELYFALLSDWTDAPEASSQTDADLLDAAGTGIARLNRRYPPAAAGPRFLLLHRHRVWSETEGCWIAWERKRGKLHELNRLLRGAAATTFIDTAAGPPQVPAGVRYVVTLDADTRLPRDTIRRLIGKMAHPLNRPRFDPACRRVVEGYAVLQPRVTPSLPVGREGSLFQRIFSSVSGIDPYASAVSDVYQDLFGEGSYAGKGIYDVDAFEAALAGRVPDGALLSHDLFEGVFARAGLASDVEVVEEYPSRYDAGALRHHRWARGDWQLLPWIFGGGPAVADGAGPPAMPMIGRWKMIDNLRRSLSAPAAVASLLAGWMMPFHAALIWTLFVVATLMLPTLIPVIAAVPPRRVGVTLSSHLRALGGDVRLAAKLSLLQLTLLAHQAWLMSDAVLRTLWRLRVSRRHLLQWTPAAQAVIGRAPSLGAYYRWMGGAIAIAAAAPLPALAAGGGNWRLALPFVLLWLASPAVARRVSLPPRGGPSETISQANTLALRRTARRTWRYFETFVTPLDHMLPPDNFQEDPVPVVAHRTSPTNIGLYLLSVAAAQDFGWIATGTAITRLEATMATMAGLERFRGHFYNWYDTRDLRPLEPPYVSTVDSGNLAGHLIALANACREWQGQTFNAALCRAGLGDALGLLRAEMLPLRESTGPLADSWRQLDTGLLHLAQSAQLLPASVAEAAAHLAGLAGQAAGLDGPARALAAGGWGGGGDGLLFWLQAAQDTIASHRADLAGGGATALQARLHLLEDAARAMALAMEFGFLLEPERKLLAIGYRVPEAALDSNCYDLLASEARLASFVAIAKGDIPARHWFRLGRAVTPCGAGAALISWSGSMFEYLMPSLVMRAPEGSLLAQTNRLIVQQQIDYATGFGLPWGISESAYNARDLEFTYQYSNFGVPGLGLKRGLGSGRTIAPYATALAAMVDPRAACANLVRLAEVGGSARYGFYEALDYTPGRLPHGQTVAIVRAFMAHHQGMTIVAIATALFEGAMRRRFHTEPMIQATELLLQERTPRDVAIVHPWAAEVSASALPGIDIPDGVRHYSSPAQPSPATLLLSNGRYTTMLTAAGSGYSRWGEFALSRWREDATCDDYGSYIFLRDVRTSAVWSAGWQPAGVEPDSYAVAFEEDRACFTRRDGTLTTAMDVLISAEDDAEVRRITLTNSGVRTREIDVTSYAELALAPQSADMAHPAFSKLFVQTEYHAGCRAILATRRRRAPGEPEIWVAHLAVTNAEAPGLTEFETSRAKFLGRGNTIRTAAALQGGAALSSTAGSVLDPVFSLRQRVRVAPGAVVQIAFWTIAASSRQALLDAVDTHRDLTAYDRAATLTWTQARVQLHHLSIGPGDAALYQRLGSHLLYCNRALRPHSLTIQRGTGVQSGLWAHGISGDLPILLLRIADIEYLDIAAALLHAHEYWLMKQLAVDLVILNHRQASYVQDLQMALEALVRGSQSRRRTAPDPLQGRVFVLRSDLIPAETTALLGAVARVVLAAQHGSLSDQIDRAAAPPGTAAPAIRRPLALAAPPPNPVDSAFFNGTGGFIENGREYLTVTGPGITTPAPWINVIANPDFGFQVSSEGSSYTWAQNSRENQITPWSNDPVTDRSGEALYLRDEDSGAVWCPVAQPIRDPRATYTARHGWGYSRFGHTANGIQSTLLQFVPLDAPVKISRLTLRNLSGTPRRLSVTAFVEWVLGPSRTASLPFVTTEMDTVSGAMLARNAWGREFGGRVAFLDLAGRQSEWTGDRRAFIGRNGTLDNPAALSGGAQLPGTSGAGFDPCGALRAHIVVPANGQIEVTMLLGQTGTADEARALLAKYRTADLDAVLASVTQFWDGVLGTLRVSTPARAMDFMLNGWLLYQTLACRIWARAAFYQASGAYGFRDQLQDGMALAAIRPEITRAHLLRAASRQFEEGDVQHWWLPHSGQGVRTRISDDRAWLATAVAQYVAISGDTALLDEKVPFLEGQQLRPDEHDAFFQPTVSDHTATVFEHCARALDHSLANGVHGLPLIGTGDWNDGMNRVGERGEGESVWLAWFLHTALTAFAPLADARQETERAATWRAHATNLASAVEREAWDGNWYRRGFFDDGTPLGAAVSDECRIDSIAQSWAVLSGAADPVRAARAMDEVSQQLIDRNAGVALLFAPPFDTTPLDPGYIKGYPPGIRENGGQYTHAAAWSVMAFAKLGDGERAEALFALLNPVNHSRTPQDAARYAVEPYVVAADVYALPPHAGRGGWTWYTGSAGWLQRAGMESVLGLHLSAGMLHIDPCIPKAWPGFEAQLRHGSASYVITIRNPSGVMRGILSAEQDGEAIAARPLQIPLQTTGTHTITVILGGPALHA